MSNEQGFNYNPQSYDNRNDGYYTPDGNGGYQNQPPQNSSYEQGKDGVSLFVGNFPFDCTESDLERAFSDFGLVHSVRIITDRETGKPKGFAFVAMDTMDQARTAIDKLNQADFFGRPLRVSLSTKEDSDDRSSRQGFRGGRGGAMYHGRPRDYGSPYGERGSGGGGPRGMDDGRAGGQDRSNYRTIPCKFYSRGTCNYGDKCNFIHDDNLIDGAGRGGGSQRGRGRGGRYGYNAPENYGSDYGGPNANYNDGPNDGYGNNYYGGSGPNDYGNGPYGGNGPNYGGSGPNDNYGPNYGGTGGLNNYGGYDNYSNRPMANNYNGSGPNYRSDYDGPSSNYPQGGAMATNYGNGPNNYGGPNDGYAGGNNYGPNNYSGSNYNYSGSSNYSGNYANNYGGGPNYQGGSNYGGTGNNTHSSVNPNYPPSAGMMSTGAYNSNMYNDNTNPNSGLPPGLTAASLAAGLATGLTAAGLSSLTNLDNSPPSTGNLSPRAPPVYSTQ